MGLDPMQIYLAPRTWNKVFGLALTFRFNEFRLQLHFFFIRTWGSECQKNKNILKNIDQAEVLWKLPPLETNKILRK